MDQQPPAWSIKIFKGKLTVFWQDPAASQWAWFVQISYDDGKTWNQFEITGTSIDYDKTTDPWTVRGYVKFVQFELIENFMIKMVPFRAF